MEQTIWLHVFYTRHPLQYIKKKCLSPGKIEQKVEFDGKKIVINIFTIKPSVRIPAMSIKKLHAPRRWETPFLPPFWHFYGQIHHSIKNIFKNWSNVYYINSTNGKSSKHWSRKGYGLICFDENLSRYFTLKTTFLCWLSTFPIFLPFVYSS